MIGPPKLPYALQTRCRQWSVIPTPWICVVSVASQTMSLWQKDSFQLPGRFFPRYRPVKSYRISTSRHGVGQQSGTLKTPLGLHRVAEKIGAGQLIGTAFKGRRPAGRVWQGMPRAGIVHRILWLEGLEPGWNRGGEVDSKRRYIYIHGFSDETTLGRPQSCGCIHMAGDDLIPLFDWMPEGSLVWIQSE